MRKKGTSVYRILLLASLVISALTLNIFGLVLGSPKRNVLYSTDPDLNLMIIDPSTGVAEMVGPIGYSIEALSFSPEGVLYATADIYASGLHGAAQTLITIDPDTGAGTVVGAIGYGDVDALAFSPDGTLYGVDAGSTLLLEIDRTTGAGSEIGPVGYTFIGGMDFSPKGVLYAADMVTGEGDLSTLLTIDTSSGTATEIGQIGFSSIEGIAFDKDGTLYGISALIGGTGSGELIKINTKTGAGKAVGMVEYIPEGGPMDMDALEFSVIARSEKLEFKANGKITHYLPEVTSSEVVHGRWDVKIMDGEVEFKGYYTELNIEDVEQSPPGTVDHFKLHFSDLWKYSIDDGVVTFWGTIHYDKKYWVVEGNSWGIDPPGNAPVDWVEDFIVAWVKIEIDTNAGEFKMDTYPIGDPPNGWNLFGIVSTYHNYT